jgi:hypothetical protein
MDRLECNDIDQLLPECTATDADNASAAAQFDRSQFAERGKPIFGALLLAATHRHAVDARMTTYVDSNPSYRAFNTVVPHSVSPSLGTLARSGAAKHLAHGRQALPRHAC